MNAAKTLMEFILAMAKKKRYLEKMVFDWADARLARLASVGVRSRGGDYEENILYLYDSLCRHFRRAGLDMLFSVHG